jgi:hypothetical protein
MPDKGTSFVCRAAQAKKKPALGAGYKSISEEEI